MRIALQQNTVWLIQFSFVKDMPSETDDRKGAGLCGEWKALWRVATLCLNGAYQQNEKKKNKYKIWFGHTLLSQCCWSLQNWFISALRIILISSTNPTKEVRIRVSC